MFQENPPPYCPRRRLATGDSRKQAACTGSTTDEESYRRTRPRALAAPPPTCWTDDGPQGCGERLGGTIMLGIKALLG